MRLVTLWNIVSTRSNDAITVEGSSLAEASANWLAVMAEQHLANGTDFTGTEADIIGISKSTKTAWVE